MSIGSKAFVQLASINSPADTSSFSLIWFTMLSRCFRYLNLKDIGMLLLSTTRYFIVHTWERLNQSFDLLKVLLETFSPFTIIALFATYPFQCFDKNLSPSTLCSKTGQWFSQDKGDLIAAIQKCICFHNLTSLPMLQFNTFTYCSIILLIFVPLLTEVHLTLPSFGSSLDSVSVR